MFGEEFTSLAEYLLNALSDQPLTQGIRRRFQDFKSINLRQIIVRTIFFGNVSPTLFYDKGQNVWIEPNDFLLQPESRKLIQPPF